MTLLRAYLWMLPALLATWLLATRVPGGVLQAALVGLALSVLYVPIGVRALRIPPGGNPVRRAVVRGPSHLTNLLMLGAFGAFAAGVGATIGAMLGSLLGVPRLVGQLACGALAVLPLLWWHWPMLVLAFVSDDRHGARWGPGIWLGPGYAASRRLVRAEGRRDRTAAVLGVLYLWSVLLMLASGRPIDSPWRPVAAIGSWLVFAPALVVTASLEVRRMIDGLERREPAP